MDTRYFKRFFYLGRFAVAALFFSLLGCASDDSSTSANSEDSSAVFSKESLQLSASDVLSGLFPLIVSIAELPVVSAELNSTSPLTSRTIVTNPSTSMDCPVFKESATSSGSGGRPVVLEFLTLNNLTINDTTQNSTSQNNTSGCVLTPSLVVTGQTLADTTAQVQTSAQFNLANLALQGRQSALHFDAMEAALDTLSNQSILSKFNCIADLAAVIPGVEVTVPVSCDFRNVILTKAGDDGTTRRYSIGGDLNLLYTYNNVPNLPVVKQIQIRQGKSNWNVLVREEADEAEGQSDAVKADNGSTSSSNSSSNSSSTVQEPTQIEVQVTAAVQRPLLIDPAVSELPSSGTISIDSEPKVKGNIAQVDITFLPTTVVNRKAALTLNNDSEGSDSEVDGSEEGDKESSVTVPFF